MKGQHRTRIEALEASTAPTAPARPLYFAVERLEDATPEMRGAKLYIGGISPDDWDTPEEPNHDTQNEN